MTRWHPYTWAREVWALAMPRPDLRPAEVWARETLRLGEGMSADYGGQPWDIELVPHTRLIFDFFADPVARELHLMKSSQAQMTSATIVALLHRLTFYPGSAMYVMNNAEEMRGLSKTYIKPFLRQIFGIDVIDDPKQSTLFIETPHGAVLRMGSPTENFMRGKPATVVIMDEYDNYPDILEGGSDEPLAAARQRVKAARKWSKIITLSTPHRRYNPDRRNHVQAQTKQHREYLTGDQREYRIVCPACRHEWAPGKSDLIYDHCRHGADQPELGLSHDTDGLPRYDLARVLKETYLRCPLCGKGIYEGEEKRAAVRAGRWVPTRPDADPRIWSAKHTDLVALIGNSTLGQIASEIIAAERAGSRAMIGVMRSRFAQPEDDEEAPEQSLDTIKKHCGPHERGMCPVMPWFIGMAIDCQKGKTEKDILFKWARIAFSSAGEKWVIDYGATLSKYELREVFRAPILGPKNEAGEPVKLYCHRAVIDSGYRAGADATGREEETMESFVYPMCLEWGINATGTWWLTPLKGRSPAQMQGEALRLSSAEIEGGEIPLHLFNDDWFKRQLYHLELAYDPTDAHDKRRHTVRRWHFPIPRDELDEKFLGELITERLTDVTVRSRGRLITRREWRVPSKAKNDYGDVLKMGDVLFALVAQHAVPQGAAA